MKFIYVSETSYTHSLKATSYAIFSMCFDYNMSYEVKCGFFHLLHYVGAQKFFGLRAFWVLGSGMINLQQAFPTASFQKQQISADAQDLEVPNCARHRKLLLSGMKEAS